MSNQLGKVLRPAIDRFAEKIALTDSGGRTSLAATGKTHCPQGHPYAGDNLYIHPTKGLRYCRACGRKRAAEKYRAKKAS